MPSSPPPPGGGSPAAAPPPPPRPPLLCPPPPTAARRQFSSGAARPPARLAPLRPRPRLGARETARLGCDGGQDVRKGRRECPTTQNDARGGRDIRGTLGQGA